MGSVRSPSVPQFLVIGAGSRGTSYARAVNKATSGTIVAVADPDSYKRADFGRRYIWGTEIGGRGSPSPGQEFNGWKEYVEWETERRKRRAAADQNGTTPNDHDDGSDPAGPQITGVFICTLDQTHAEIIQALAPLHLHILCEKPLALTLADCLTISQALAAHPPRIFSIGHVLRYSPHNMLLRRLLCEDQVAGEIVSVEHTEPVGYWHFAHSYVRGNWRHSLGRDGVGSLLTKSCHDVDFLLWLMCSPSTLTGHRPHLPARVTSSGALTHFRRGRKPKAAGAATNCTDCAVERECVYSAKRIYRDMFLREDKQTNWPLRIIVPEIEDLVDTRGWEGAEERLMERLGEDYEVGVTKEDDVRQRGWYGRCVYESDNDVVDDQTVVLTWDDEEGVNGRGPKHAVFHMTYPTQAQCERRGRIYGTRAEISYDSKKIEVFSFDDRRTTVHEIPKQDPEVEKSHGGGDAGLAGAFVNAVQAVDDGTLDVNAAQWRYVGCDLEECIRSHAAVFAAEEARVDNKVVDWNEWWETRVVNQIPRGS